jgi:hypothetical protein
MSKRSVVTSMVLASVLVLSGCGGSSSSEGTKAGGLADGQTAQASIPSIVFSKANGKTEYTVDVEGSTNDGSGKAASLRCADTKDAAGNDTCTKASDECSVKCAVEAVSCGNSAAVTRVEAEDRYAAGYGIAALNYANANKGSLKYNPATDMLVYGGAIVLDVNGFSSADIKVDVKGMSCGKSINHKDGTVIGGAGFANAGHQVFALVKVMDKDGNQILDDQWAPVDTMDESGNFTIDLNGINLGNGADNKVEVLLFSNKPAKTGEGAPISGTTGVSGAGS